MVLPDDVSPLKSTTKPGIFKIVSRGAAQEAYRATIIKGLSETSSKAVLHVPGSPAGIHPLDRFSKPPGGTNA